MSTEEFARLCFDAEECAKGFVPRWDLLPRGTEAILLKSAAAVMEQLRVRRWASFTDDELRAIAFPADTPPGWVELEAEAEAELERRRTDG